MRSWASPVWRVPSSSPGPRISRSRCAISNPSVVLRSTSRRARAASVRGPSYIIRQALRFAPRPTRPRNWWSWARPRRSAFSTIISEALGTSTPTSMTVVATSTSNRAALNASIAASFSAGFIRPCTRPTRRSGRASASSAAVSSAARHASASDSSMAVQTQYACSPPAHARRTRATTSGRRCDGATAVSTGVRPGGSSSITETSRSAYAVIARVRGIGVAVMTSWCGRSPPRSPLSRSASRWPTPNRCCSSTMTSPRSAKATCDWNSAWVPTATAVSAPAMRAVARARSPAASRPESQSTRTPRGSSQPRRFT